MPLPVDVDADADVLTGLVVDVPAPARLDDQGGCVASLRNDLDDLAAELASGPQGVHHVQVVVGQQGSGHSGDQAPHDLRW